MTPVKAERTPTPILVFLVRHAIAAQRGSEFPDDTKRPLTHRGIARMRQAVLGLRQLGARPAVVATSPLVRARQTADLLVAGLRPEPTLTTLPSLAPGFSPADTASDLKTLADAGSVALVGHEPDLGELAAWMIGARSPVPFKKGGVCLIELPTLLRPRDGTLIWLATPRMLRALAP